MKGNFIKIKNMIVNLDSVESIFDLDEKTLCIRYISGRESFIDRISSEKVWEIFCSLENNSHK